MINLDSLGQEVRIGDIIQYAIERGDSIIYNHGLVEKFSTSTSGAQAKKLIQKPRILRFEFGCQSRWNTPNGKWGPGADYTLDDFESISEHRCTLGSFERLTVITSLKLPDNNIFNELRIKSNKLLGLNNDAKL